MHSAFSSFHLAEFVIDNIWYEKNKHYFISEKAALFDDGIYMQQCKELNANNFLM